MKNIINLKQKQHKLIPIKITKKVFIFIVFIFLFELFLFPTFPALANISETENNTTNISPIIEDPLILNENETENINNDENFINTLPETKTWKTVKTNYYTVTAYNSEAGQCDDTPCISANGFNLCKHNIEDSVATNAFPFGTKIRMPELFGDRIFIVRDRMNKRYVARFDVWMKNKEDAKKFGIKVTKIEILEP
ncbi:hypothetical protein A2331_06035 [Candidatus Falkowbacteria bacterium RIFOXYB2_FULL_34_18]|uniref:3D domain-containing protein n=1 Tax=Candidatus Falkowbacteria bacterium RIFOXYD2_FULL_34_120 TaxID=1798007 RepID=A0A1F5TPI0_9BACT|nr:MAG: hypothetical protein A2331_06035 [Candidatus Falkowbacteria bacterium RIFOXYB2_FULL_34_18]OGF29053.1 MAG: hypothetical protein A2500_03360 [Candidatus Falkowbacteria bacterium RIFOXYC12_FULL_34_55]OGF36137.1 MAG: hypothetical protein A2466_03610 [Candidatus Falkowbacteria bacterium RIFOXYC2_FULL_34_220]OGF38589.1 MAG: hypothetical protein A2515_04870 [Candidatus Falkowbacteria bacterium RIFOXYD12_FULL_34_57]OGF40738.1 MAG: hypothetical protein A2531_06885 [Candidatus Falkowbacteria bact